MVLEDVLAGVVCLLEVEVVPLCLVVVGLEERVVLVVLVDCVAVLGLLERVLVDWVVVAGDLVAVVVVVFSRSVFVVRFWAPILVVLMLKAIAMLIAAVRILYAVFIIQCFNCAT